MDVLPSQQDVSVRHKRKRKFNPVLLAVVIMVVYVIAVIAFNFVRGYNTGAAQVNASRWPSSYRCPLPLPVGASQDMFCYLAVPTMSLQDKQLAKKFGLPALYEAKQAGGATSGYYLMGPFSKTCVVYLNLKYTKSHTLYIGLAAVLPRYNYKKYYTAYGNISKSPLSKLQPFLDQNESHCK